MLIDCETCTMRGPGCRDCVVSVLLDSGAGLDEVERDAVATLSALGLVPPLRLVASLKSPDYPGKHTHSVTADEAHAS